MRITIDTELQAIIVPDSYYMQVDKLNEIIASVGNNTDTNLKRQSDVVVKRNKSDKNESK